MGHHVVITGASSGIGRASALLLAKRGFDVFATVRREQDAEQLRSEGMPNVEPLLLDVTNVDTIERAAREVQERVGSAGLFGIVNNAGVSLGGPIEYVDVGQLRACFEVNVFGAVAVTRAFLPLVHKAGSGRIINISSIAGRVTAPMMGPYCASKFALESISDALRVELRQSGITVSLIEPGFVETAMVAKGNQNVEGVLEALPPGAPARYRQALEGLLRQFEAADGRRASPEAVAKVVHRALTVSRPASRYKVGADARLLSGLYRVLPTRVMDPILALMIGL